MRALPTIALLLTISACGMSAGSGEHACTEIGTPVGIGLEVEPPLASKVTRATLEACWDGSCRTSHVNLMPSTSPARTTCVGDVCSADMEPTGGKNAFADIAGLPEKPVEVTLKLSGSSGTVLERTLEVTPRMQFPNGPGCPGGGPQAQLTVSGAGDVG